MNRHRSPAASLVNRRPDPTARRTMESLEGRRLLAAAVNRGVLTLTGTSGNDTVAITKSGSNYSVVENGSSAQSFAVSAVTGILANLGDGNGTISVGTDVAVPATLNGGNGNDTILPGLGNDTINTGDGDDVVSYADRSTAITGNLRVTPIYIGDANDPGLGAEYLAGNRHRRGRRDRYVCRA